MESVSQSGQSLSFRKRVHKVQSLRLLNGAVNFISVIYRVIQNYCRGFRGL
jgi:hypothetical protein